MLSVMERMDVVDEAEAIAAARRYADLLRFVDEVSEEVLASDPTLRYLRAFAIYMTGQEIEARSALDTLWESVSRVNDRLYRRILNLRAIVDIELGDLQRAIQLLSDLETVSVLANDHRYTAFATLNHAIALDIMGFPLPAISALERARLSFQRLGDLSALAGCAHNLGMCYRKVHCFRAADDEFAWAADHYSKHGSIEEQTATAMERALTLSFAGESLSARSSATRALGEANTLGNERLRAEGTRVLGAIELHLGNYTQARNLLEDALTKATALGLRLLRAESLSDLARVAQHEGDEGNASKLLRDAARTFLEMGAPQRARDLVS